MNYVRTVKRGVYNFAFGLGESNAVFLHVILKNSQIVYRHDEVIVKTFFVRVGTENAYVVTFGFKESYEIHRRNRSSVVLFAQNVTHYRYRHLRCSPLRILCIRNFFLLLSFLP